MEGFARFEFDLPGALLRDLIVFIEKMKSVELIEEHLKAVPEEQGIYLLYYQGELVYIGKTDARAGLQHRLNRHKKFIEHRKNLQPEFVGFKAIHIPVFSAMKLEEELIAHYKQDGDVSWNHSGFGSNDPGRRRDHTQIKSGGFDDLFPVNIDIELDFLEPSEFTVHEVLIRLKDNLSYNFRYEVDGQPTGHSYRRSPHPDYAAAMVNIEPPMTSRQVFHRIIEALPSGWQITHLPHIVIMYKERETYQYALDVIRK
jgi:hypothetical protein